MGYLNKNLLNSLLIIGVSALVIFWQFPRLPQRLAFDEVEFVRLAMKLQNQLVLYSPEATGHATPYFYLLLVSIKIFGVNTFALRLPAAIFGLVNPLLVYLIFNFYFKKRQTAFWGTIIFATMHWVFQFARFAFEGTYLLFWELVAIYNLLIFDRNQKVVNFLLLALATVMTFYSYLPGRIFFLLPLGYFFRHRAPYKIIGWYLGILLLFALPLLVATGAVENRVSSLTYLTQSLPISEKATYFVENLSRNLLMLNFQGDTNARHNYPGKPALNPLLGGLFWIGLFLGIKKQPKYRLFLCWIALSIVGTLFTLPTENPHFLRTYTVTVGVVFFITLALEKLWPKDKAMEYLLIGLLFLSVVYEVRTYFKYQKKVFLSAFESTAKDLEQFKEP